MPRCCHKPRHGFRKAFQHARVVTLRCFLLCLEFRPRNDFNIFKQRRIPCLGCMGKGSWIFKIRFLQPIGTWKTQRMTQNRLYRTPYMFDEMQCLQLCNQHASSCVRADTLQWPLFTLGTWPTQSAMFGNKKLKRQTWLSDSTRILLEMSSL